MADGPYTRDRHPGMRDEEAIAIGQNIDFEVFIADDTTMVVDDPQIEETGSISIDERGNLLIL